MLARALQQCVCRAPLQPLQHLPLALSRALSSVPPKKKAKGGGDAKRVGLAREAPAPAPSAGAAAAAAAGGAPAGGAAEPRPASELGEVIMTLRGVEKRLPGGRVLFRGVNLAFQRGAKIGVLGLNGSGKSSLLKILAGEDAEYDGECWRGEGLRVGYLAQEPALDEGKSVHENIMDGLRAKTALLERFDALSAALGEEGADFEALLAEQAEVQAAIEAQGCWSLAHVVQQAKEALRVPPDGAAVATLSGGERRRVALCRLLLEQPELLLLDEPTNHLDATSVAWLERYLAQYKGTVLAVTHDRYFLDNVAGWILEVAGGGALPFQGNYTGWLERKATRAEGEAKLERKRARAMEEELAWIRQGPKGRQSKSKARIARFEKDVEAQAEERGRERLVSGAMVIPPGPRLGDIVLEVAGLSRTLQLPAREDGSAGGSKVLFKDVNFALPRGGIVGIIGPNGAGKTSLLRCLIGDEGFEADAGTVKFGQTVRVGIVSQSRAELEGNMRVLEAVCGSYDTVEYGPGVEMPARQYLACFNLVGEQQTKLVRSLSGGERNRVHLARVLRTGVNLLMLDEPTNDLDIDTLRSLEEAMLDWDGCAVCVSHDRYFLDRVCTHMLIFHAEGRVQWFEGSYSDYIAYLTALGKEAVAQGLYVLPGTGAAEGEAFAGIFKNVMK